MQNLALPAVIDDEAVADAAAMQWLPPLLWLSGIQVLRILMAKVANCSKRELANRIHAEPIRQILRRQRAEHASIGRCLVAQRQQHELKVENIAISATAAGAGNSSDTFARHLDDQIVDAGPALLVPKVDESCTSQL